MGPFKLNHYPREMGLDLNRLNLNGDAAALGHSIGTRAGHLDLRNDLLRCASSDCCALSLGCDGGGAARGFHHAAATAELRSAWTGEGARPHTTHPFHSLICGCRRLGDRYGQGDRERGASTRGRSYFDVASLLAQ